jgi:hypothetical protein
MAISVIYRFAVASAASATVRIGLILVLIFAEHFVETEVVTEARLVLPAVRIAGPARHRYVMV